MMRCVAQSLLRSLLFGTAYMPAEMDDTMTSHDVAELEPQLDTLD